MSSGPLSELALLHSWEAGSAGRGMAFDSLTPTSAVFSALLLSRRLVWRHKFLQLPLRGRPPVQDFEAQHLD